MPYTYHYERDIHGIITFWLHNNYDHSRFFDREISHHEMELARANQHMMQQLGAIYEKSKSKAADPGMLMNEGEQAAKEFHSLIAFTLDKALHCDVIISTPQSLLDHMLREAEETVSVFKLLQSGNRVSPADAVIYENYFWLRQMSDHLIYISHYVDGSNYQLHDEIRRKTKKFNNLFLQANALRTLIRFPRKEVLPSLNGFSQMVVKDAKDLEAFKLELDALIKQCAAVTTSPPDLLEHIAREAHHLWRNLEDQVVL